MRARLHGLARWIAACCIVALASGCTVGPDFKPPSADAPATWHDMQRTATQQMNDSHAPASVPTIDSDPDPRWWRSFDDPTLESLIARAVQGNLELQQAVWRIVEARTQVQGTAAQGLPNISATASYKREQLGAKGLFESQGIYDDVNRLGEPNSPIDQIAPGAGPKVQQAATNALNRFTEPINLWQVGFDASWELDLFGRVRRSVESATAQVKGAEESRNDALISLEAEVAQTYIQLRGAQALHTLTSSLVDEQSTIVDLTRSQARVGLASELDVKSASAQLAQTRALLPQYDQQAEQAMNGLAYLIGETPGALDAELAAPSAIPPGPPTIPVGVPSTLARRRPDIRRAEASLHAATANVGVAVAQFFPDISLTGQIGTRATNARDLARWSHLFWSVGPAISLPVFQGGALVSNLHLSKAEQQVAALDYRKAVLGALRDVDNALTVYRTDQSHRDALADEAAAQQSAFDLARDSYRKGLVSFINVLDAERQLSQARQQHAQATMQVSTDLVALYKALGGGWQEDAVRDLQPR
ncbi:efflux transporter outer membrane subunit [Paraburkholderia diazotrophica]|uniref:Efflux transporter, outer membrane factor (OMF) lipoprotein, NodT family n=1 Tax=Paraburkholderia diazotrophica TaxID=667676 RepID=A0A1H7BBN9_9BURK|nr:efflux transporter outer membrane subunit [Paraburkholderia diazotrophica]SEJ75103.1 efflux transporter, outer membrane factor (OMF) lipoprotein, NodT family [Paraburkholderia diazotrophica]